MIVDDHQKVRISLRLGLELWDEVVVVGEANSGEEAVQLAPHIQPDVILMDLDMPGMDGAEATRTISQSSPGINVLILTGTVDYDRIKVALAAGAVDYLLKTAHLDEILQAIQGAALNKSA